MMGGVVEGLSRVGWGAENDFGGRLLGHDNSEGLAPFPSSQKISRLRVF